MVTTGKYIMTRNYGQIHGCSSQNDSSKRMVAYFLRLVIRDIGKS